MGPVYLANLKVMVYIDYLTGGDYYLFTEHNFLCFICCHGSNFVEYVAIEGRKIPNRAKTTSTMVNHRHLNPPRGTPF